MLGTHLNNRFSLRKFYSLAALLLCLSLTAHAQTTTPNPSDHAASLVPSKFLKNFAQDQRDIWGAPFKARIEDMNWLVPAMGVTAGLMNADAELSSRFEPTDALVRRSATYSDAALAAAVVGAGGLYVLGKWRGNDHETETGILSGEAFLNSYLVNEILKLVSRRERPNEGTGQGKFFRGTVSNSSFPSNHVMLTWSVATVIAHEYPGPLTKFLAYGLATSVGVA